MSKYLEFLHSRKKDKDYSWSSVLYNTQNTKNLSWSDKLTAILYFILCSDNSIFASI